MTITRAQRQVYDAQARLYSLFDAVRESGKPYLAYESYGSVWNIPRETVFPSLDLAQAFARSVLSRTNCEHDISRLDLFESPGDSSVSVRKRQGKKIAVMRITFDEAAQGYRMLSILHEMSHVLSKSHISHGFDFQHNLTALIEQCFDPGTSRLFTILLHEAQSEN